MQKDIHEILGITIDDYIQLKINLNNAILKAGEKLTRDNCEQEDPYFISFFAILASQKVFFGNDNKYFIELSASKTTDRGKGAAESKYGCDFGFTFSWNLGNNESFKKAIIAQAKNDSNLSKKTRENLTIQCKKMEQLTPHYIVMLRDKIAPIIHIGENSSFSNEGISLCDYIVDKVLSCFHGDQDNDVILRVSRSDLKLIKIKTNLPKPRPRTKINLRGR